MSEEKVAIDTKPVLDVQPEAAAEPSAAPAAAPEASNGSGGSKRPAEDEEAAMNADGDKPDNKRGKFFDSRGGKGGKGSKGKFQQQQREKREKNKEKGRARGQRQGGWKARAEVDEEAAMNAAAAGGSTAPAKKEGDDGEEKEKRLPKKRAAVLLGYCGTGYSGMQIQTHGSKTIEGDLFDALAKAGAISAENATDHKKVDIQRAARTDAGVHAAGNCISLKMILDPPLPEGFSSLTEYVNSFLPAQIRMWGFVRAMKSFQARTACDSRVYEYLLPSYCLLPPAKTDPLAEQLDKVSPGWREVVKVPAEFVDAAPAVPEPAEGDPADPKSRGEFERRRGWRIDPDTLQRFRNMIAEYQGTHNFHNYTVGKPFKDATVKRYMKTLDVRDPAVYGDIEWISVRIHGQSFMLHQIRKMMSLAILATRTGTPPKIIPATFENKRVHIPKAPPLGLLLEQPQFKTYNDKAQKLPNHGAEPRELVDFSKYEDVMHKFKVEWIYERLRELEFEQNTFHKWVRQIDCSGSKDFTYLNTEGVIPETALQTLTSKKYILPGDKPPTADGDVDADMEAAEKALDSDDEDAALEGLSKEELEG